MIVLVQQNVPNSIKQVFYICNQLVNKKQKPRDKLLELCLESINILQKFWKNFYCKSKSQIYIFYFIHSEKTHKTCFYDDISRSVAQELIITVKYKFIAFAILPKNYSQLY